MTAAREPGETQAEEPTAADRDAAMRVLADAEMYAHVAQRREVIARALARGDL